MKAQNKDVHQNPIYIFHFEDEKNKQTNEKKILINDKTFRFLME